MSRVSTKTVLDVCKEMEAAGLLTSPSFQTLDSIDALFYGEGVDWSTTAVLWPVVRSGNTTNATTKCPYCGNGSGKRDRRGNCVSCGAP